RDLARRRALEALGREDLLRRGEDARLGRARRLAHLVKSRLHACRTASRGTGHPTDSSAPADAAAAWARALGAATSPSAPFGAAAPLRRAISCCSSARSSCQARSRSAS